MPTLKLMHNYVDSRSILACMGVIMLNWLSQFHFAGIITFGFITVKVLLEFLGSILTISTIVYNVVKTINEVKKFIMNLKWFKKREEKEEIDAAELFSDDTPKP